MTKKSDTISRFFPEGSILAGIVDNLFEGVYIADRNRIIRHWNKAAEIISGYSAAEVVGKTCADGVLTHVDAEGNNLCAGACPLAAAIADRRPHRAEIYLHHKDGHRVPVSVRVFPVFDPEGRVVGGIELFFDLSNQEAGRLRIKELEQMALIDDLTRLANRKYIEREIEKRFEEMKRYRTPFGILFMDIDHFKKFNDTFGHETGDRVLKYVANTFIVNSRPFDLYGRWGGEEFIGVIRNVNKPELKRIGERMRTLIDRSYLLEGEDRLRVTVSFGAAVVREDDTRRSLLRRADRLLYESKKKGRNCLSIG